MRKLFFAFAALYSLPGMAYTRLQWNCTPISASAPNYYVQIHYVSTGGYFRGGVVQPGGLFPIVSFRDVKETTSLNKPTSYAGENFTLLVHDRVGNYFPAQVYTQTYKGETLNLELRCALGVPV